MEAVPDRYKIGLHGDFAQSHQASKNGVTWGCTKPPLTDSLFGGCIELPKMCHEKGLPLGRENLNSAGPIRMQ